MNAERRQLLGTIGRLALGASIFPSFNPLLIDDIKSAAERIADKSPGDAARDEEFWLQVQAAYTVSRDFINLENGYFSPAPNVVLEAQVQNIRMINEIPSFYMRRRQADER